jgi:hypothetical protein
MKLEFEGAKSQKMREFISTVSGTLLRDGIHEKLTCWQPLECLEGCDWGTCEVSAPKAPKACWNSDGTRRYLDALRALET